MLFQKNEAIIHDFEIFTGSTKFVSSEQYIVKTIARDGRLLLLVFVKAFPFFVAKK